MATEKQPGYLARFFDQILNTGAANDYWNAMGLDMTKANPNADPELLRKTRESMRQAYTKNPLSVRAEYTDFVKSPEGTPVTGNALKTNAGVLWENAQAHPGKAIATGLLGAGNIAGLVDNDKLIGQAIGTVGGGLLGSKLLQLKPYGTLNSALIGGALGSLFDALSAKREREEQYQQQY